MADPAAIAGGLRSLLLQVAHPSAMAGVHDHSDFRGDPLGRLQRTSNYVAATTFGSTREALHAVRIVRAVHRGVRGTTPQGRSYRAEDPDLLAWVSVALTSSMLVTDELWAADPVTGADADAFVAEQSRIAALLDPRVDPDELEHDPLAREQWRAGHTGLPMLSEGTLPSSVEELRLTLESYRPQLGLNDQGRAALAFLRHPPLPLAARGAYQALVGGAFASLEPAQRRALDLTPVPIARTPRLAAAGATLSALRLASGTSPTLRVARHRVTAPSAPSASTGH